MCSLRRLAHAQEPKSRNGLGLALQLERLDRLDLGPVADERKRRLPDQHLARLGSLLQPRGHVDRVARHQTFFGAGHHLAGGEADPRLKAELGQRVAHLRHSADGAKRVVFMEHRYAEDGHDCIPDELLHRPAVVLDDLLHPFEVVGEQPPERLRVDRLPQ